MGIFDFLKRGSNPPSAAPTDRRVAGPAKLVADKRAQPYDRAEAIQKLCDIKSAEAAEALLRRFTFSIDPSITDQEEKDAAYSGIVEIGKPAAPHIIEFLERAEIITWPLRMLHAILSEEEYREELLKFVDTFDTEYSRNVEPKVQAVSALEDISGDDVRAAAERFLEDVNETVRFHAVQSTFAQNNPESIEALLRMASKEESVRVKNKVFEGLLLKGWVIPASLRSEVATALRDVDAFDLKSDGTIVRLRN